MNNLDGKSLKKIIKEMINVKIENEMNECGDMEEEYKEPHEPQDADSYEVDPDGYEGFMAKSNLFTLAKNASMLHNIIEDNENLEPWVEEKIAVAAEMIDSVAEYLEYSKMSKKR